MRRYRSVRTRRMRRIRALVAAGVFLLLLVVVHLRISKTLISVAEASLRSLAAEVMNGAASSVLQEGAAYGEFISVRTGTDGQILSITANTLRTNAAAREIASLSQKNLTERTKAGIGIPLGAFFGVESWAGFGPEISVKILPFVAVTSEFYSEFQSAGINQTRHAVYLQIEADVTLIVPPRTREFSAAVQVLVCESVLLGAVPEVYLNGQPFSGYHTSQ